MEVYVILCLKLRCPDMSVMAMSLLGAYERDVERDPPTIKVNSLLGCSHMIGRQNRFVLAVPFFQRGEWRSASLGAAWRSDLLPSAGLKLEIISTSTPDASDLSEVQPMRCVRRSQK